MEKPALQKALTEWKTAGHAAPPQPNARHPEHVQQRRPERLEAEREEHDVARQPRRVDTCGATSAPRRREPLVPERQAAAERDDDQAGEGDHAEPAELDQQEQEGLPGGREVGGGVDDDQPRDAHGAGGGEQRVEPAERLGRVEAREQLEAERAERTRAAKEATKSCGGVRRRHSEWRRSVWPSHGFTRRSGRLTRRRSG